MSATNTSLVTLDNAVGQRAQAEKYLDNILKFKPITSSKQSYSRFLDIFVSSVKSLKDLDVGDLTEYILYSVAMRKLDFKTRSEFEVIVNNENVEPTVKELVNFLEKQHLVQASKESVNADKTGRQRPRRSRNQNKRDAEKTSSGGIQGENSGEENGNSTQDGSKTPDSANKSLRKIRSRSARFEKLKCSDCEENNHPVETCEMFLNLSNEDRVNFAVAVKVCFTCLKPGHSRFSCPQKNNTCEKCSSRHHVLLHTETKRIRKFLIFKRTRSDKRNSNGPNDRSGSVSNGQSSTEQKLKNCILCEEKCHNLDVCEIFLGYDPEKRLVVIRKNRLCANCFATNHGSRRCPLKSNCDQCRGKHHDKVHEIFSLNRQSKTNDIATPDDCILCNEKYHNLDVCDVFLGYDLEKRSDVVKKNRLCANCFEHNHPSRRCPMESNCNQCKGKHHAKVHEPENCVLCNEKYHNLAVCDMFNTYEDPEKRFDVIKKNRLCANCFETNHPSRRCPMESNCDQCKGKHHAKVHEIFSLNRQSKTNDISIPEDCILCKEKYHNLDVCEVFLGYDLEKRSDVVKKNMLCANCFEHNHISRRCHMESNCDQCKGKHHAKVHGILSLNRQSKTNDISIPENCILCNEKYHNLNVCDIFNSYEDPEKHLDVIRKNRLCANCFEPSHMSRRCPMESNCDQCKGKHHAKVHLKYQRESNKHGYIKRNGNDVDSTPESARSQSEIVSNGALEDKDTKMMNSLRDMQACLDAMHNVSVSN